MYWNLRDNERLITALYIANTPDLLRNFLKDLLTEKEIELLSRRLRVACLLHDGAPYSEVRKITGLGYATIAQISKKLADKRGGYNSIIRQMNPHGQRYFD